MTHCERPSIPPPAPPKKLDKPSVGNKPNPPTNEKMSHGDADSRSSGLVVSGLKQANSVGLATVGLSDESKTENNCDLSADSDLGFETRSTNTSGVSDVADLSWNSDSDQPHSAAAQPKEDIRKMTAQLKRDWWHNSPTPADRTAAKMSTEISGKFNPRASPSLDGKPDTKISENDICGSKPEIVESDNNDERLETVEIKWDTVDTVRDNTGDLFGSTDIKCDVIRLGSDSVGKPPEEQKSESQKLDSEPTVSKYVPVAAPRCPPIPSPRMAVDRVPEPVAAESGKSGTDTSELAAPSCETTTASTSTALVDNESLGQSHLSVDMPQISPTSSCPASPPVPQKPARSPPARPPPFTSRKPSADGKPDVPDSPAELPAKPQSDLPPKTRTLDRVRPEKPPPPLPRSLPSEKSETADESEGRLDSIGDVVVSEDIATHDEDTRL